MGGGEPVWVFLHGFLGTGADWAPVLDALAEQRARPRLLLTPDLPGHGRTPLIRPTYTAWGHWLDALLAPWPRRPVVMVGYSLGGRVALAWAARRRSRVRALALLSAHPGLRGPWDRWRRRALDAARARQLRAQGLAAFLESWYRLPLFALASRPALRQAVLTRRRGQSPRALASVLTGLSPGRQPPLWDALPRLAGRGLYLAGAWDAKYATLARRLAVTFPALRVAILPQAGHLLPLDAPRAVAAHLAAWAAQGFRPLRSGRGGASRP